MNELFIEITFFSGMYFIKEGLVAFDFAAEVATVLRNEAMFQNSLRVN